MKLENGAQSSCLKKSITQKMHTNAQGDKEYPYTYLYDIRN